MTTKLAVYQEALRLIGEHDIASTAVDEEPRYVLDGEYDNAILYCLAQGWWRFAFFTAAAAPAGSATVPGYTQAFAKPTSWLRTHSVGIINGTTRLVPIDFNEQGTSIYVKYATGVVHKYLKASATEIDPTNWPEVFAKLIAAYLAFVCCERISQSRTVKADLAKIFQERLATARALESHTPPLTLPEHAVERAARGLLEQGFWRHSVITVAPTATTSPAVGYSNVFTTPADYLRVYDVLVESSGKLRPIDWRVEGAKLSAKSSAVRLQYVSSNYVDPSTWPEAFIDAVEQTLTLASARATGDGPPDKIEAAKAALDKTTDAALAKDGLPRPLALPEHAVETSARELLEQGFWRHTIKIVAPSTTTGPAAGYSAAFTPPADLLRIYDVNQVASGVILPVDWQATPSIISANAAAVRLRYVSSDFLVPSTWTEAFAQAVDASLALKAALSGGIAMAAKAAEARAMLDKVVDAALAKDGLPRPKMLAEHAVRQSARALLEQGFWRHSIKTVALTDAAGSPATGYAYGNTIATDALRVYDVTIVAGTKLRPVDWRLEGTKLSTKQATARLQYVSSDFIDSATWNETFARAVEAYLMLADAQARGAPAADLEKLRAGLDAITNGALGKDMLPRPRLMPEHAVERSARKLLEDGFWRFSVKTVTPASTTGPAAGYSNAYTLPADHLRTYDVGVLATNGTSRLYQIDRQEEGGKLSTQFAANVRLRYVSSDFLVPSTWPETFAHALDVMLSIEALRAADPATDVKVPAAQLAKMLDAELGKERLPRPLLLQPGAVDRVVRAQLEQGLWKFAIKTVALTPSLDTPSPGYAYAFDKPSDWQRTVRVFRLVGSGVAAREYDIDFRDELSDLHANYSPIHLRYLLTTAISPTGWTELFATAFDAGLRYESAVAEQLPDGEVQARLKTWRTLLGEAQVKDGLNERPKVYNTGTFNSARRGSGAGVGRRDPQWPYGI